MVYQTLQNSIAGWYFIEDEIREAIAGNILLNPSTNLTNAFNLNCYYLFYRIKRKSR